LTSTVGVGELCAQSIVREKEGTEFNGSCVFFSTLFMLHLFPRKE